MISGYKIERYPFITGIIAGTDQVSLDGYEHLDIITDGAINPYANCPNCNCVLSSLDEEELLYIVFNDNEKLLISHEMRDYDVRKKQWYKLFYKAPNAAAKTFQGGYGNLYIVKKKYRGLYIHFDRMNPVGCVRDQIQNGKSKSMWIGSNRIDPSWDLLIPYIPPGYERIHARIDASGLGGGSMVFSYYCPYDTKSDSGVYISDIANPPCHSDRVKITVTNNGMSPAYISLYVELCNKSDTR